MGVRRPPPDDQLADLSVDRQVSASRDVFDRDADPGVAGALDGDRDAGVVSWGPTGDVDAPEATGEIGMLDVSPDHVGLWVLEANQRGRGFYEHMGWRPDGARGEHMAECARSPMLRYVTVL